MKLFYLLLFFFFFFNLTAQNKRVAIRGVVLNNSIPIENVHIMNTSSKKGSLSNEKGLFQISVKENDTLVFSDIQFLVEERIVTDQILTAKQLIINLKIKRNELDEIVLYEPNNIAKALHLPNAGKKPLNKLERRLNYYSQESVPIVILLTLIGKSGGIDDIYNIISGNRKRDRKFKKLIDQDKKIELDKEYIQSIRAQFQDDFFIETLQIPREKINAFINYCLPKNIVYLYQNGRNLEIMDIFITEKKNFKFID